MSSHNRPRWPRGSAKVKALDSLDIQHYKGGRSSAICNGRLYPRRNSWYSLSEGGSVRESHGKNPQ
jgi:hypothetical protein